ncbi:bb52b886-4da0-4df4-8be6-03664f8edd25 [Sclerotinia trifoliorum]|uniref:Bb52b886-4da0-4df4-8be6-03664f8edd25 n=1 Tax=Sclerotinia trifoliorum TaxID=28548 RepID=A0A8H2VPN1_9HELO|nr:bb52b886-4da0-4df4-8be6-03664f8edd25 [Sclerotinia trifoliorum]
MSFLETSYPSGTGLSSPLDKGTTNQGCAQDNSDDSESTSDEEEDVEEEDVEENVAQFKAAIDYLNANFAALKQSKDRQQKFFKQFGQHLSAHSEYEPRNVLFWLLQQSSPYPCLLEQSSPYSWLIEHVVKNSLSLFHESSSVNYANKPLQTAISGRRSSFVIATLDSDIKDGDLEEILGLKDSNSENCIHVAVSSKLELDLILKLIGKASEDCLSAQNKDGLTPLHFAVDFSKSISSRRDIIKALIKNGDKAFDVGINSGMAARNEDSKKCSVYENLVQKYKEKTTKKPKIAPAKPGNASKEKKRLEISSQPEENLNHNIDRNLPEENKRQEKKTEDDRAYVMEVDRKTRAKMQKDNSQVNTSKPRDPLVPLESHGLRHTLTTTTRLSSTDKNKIPFSPVLAQSPPNSIKLPVSKTLQSANQESNPPLDQSKEKARLKKYKLIAHDLKLHYLRSIFQKNSNRSHDSAIKFLYGDNPNDMNICFQFPPTGQVTKNIIFNDFKRSYRKFAFDKVLQSVHFGEIQLDVPNGSRRRPEGMAKPGNGRKDIIEFFNWLKNEKEITHIVMVTVDDLKDPPHSDEALEKSLEGLDIEILDWRKWDLDPKTIQDACKKSNLREVHLYWKGNNAILRAWSEPDGLVKMEHLETIYVYASKGLLESQEKVERDYNEFRRRMHVIQGSRTIKVKDLIYNATNSNATSEGHGMHLIYSKDAGQTQIDPHQWLTVMDSFVKAICKLKPPQEEKLDQGQNYLKDSKLPQALRKDVQVALIDDGADFMHKAIGDKLNGGRSFGTGKGVAAFHGSTTGHGTYMAYMIGRICPRVEIYVCKLNVIRGGDGSASFTAESAADAVEFAVTRGFDIISISWTVQKGDNEKHINRLSSAIKKATQKNILVFCSAPDIGRATPDKLSTYYPFGDSDNENRIFRIGAAKADGSAYSWLGNVELVDCILPGDNVKLLSDDSIKEEDDIPKTGSSVATALAAGLAGLIIHCVRLAAIRHWHQNKSHDADGIDEESLKDIKNINAMKRAFKKIGTGNAGDKRLEVETFFKHRAEALQKDSNDWDQIIEVARNLLPEGPRKAKNSQPRNVISS